MLNDFTSNYGLLIGVIGMVLGVGYTFANKDKYKTLVNDIYIPGNDELRKQVSDRDRELIELDKQVAALQATLDEKDAASRQIQKLVSKLPDFAALSKQLAELSQQTNENHKEVMLAIVGKIDGK